MSSSYRIAYLNPWRNTAENQAFFSLSVAAQRIGHELIHVSETEEILAADPDFVIAIASTQPKSTHHPTFGNLHEPRRRFWENREYFYNLLSYDGYMTISPTLERFIKALLAGVGRNDPVGFYYNTPQRQELRADLRTLISENRMSLCYFGTNWDQRGRAMFRELSKKPYMRIHGPAESWAYLQGMGYHGPLPFDGTSVQNAYAEHGAGLVALSKGHLADDIISNRIFEISSVGAVAICPDTPWIRQNFGDTVYYYRATAGLSAAVADIDAAMDAIRSDPASAAQRATRARVIFEMRFAAEKLLENAVAYFEDWKNRRMVRDAAIQAPKVDVIVRCGGRPIKTIARALESIDRQSAGRFRVILVRYKPIDLDELVNRRWQRIEECDVVDCLGGGRSATLRAGLKAVRSPLFAVLDDDDLWLDNHASTLLAALAKHDYRRCSAGSGYMFFTEGRGDEPGRWWVPNMGFKGGTMWDVFEALAMPSLMASSDCLRGLVLDDWTLDSAEDSVLSVAMVSQGPHEITYRASVAFQRDSDGNSDFAGRSSRREDEFEFFLRVAGQLPALIRTLGGGVDSWDVLKDSLARIEEERLQRELGSRTELVLRDGEFAESLHELTSVTPTRLNLSELGGVSGETQIIGDGAEAVMHVLPVGQAWAYGASVALDSLSADQTWVVLEFAAGPDKFGVGLTGPDGSFLDRVEVPASAIPRQIWLSNSAAQARYAIVHNWDQPLPAAVVLEKAWAVSGA